MQHVLRLAIISLVVTAGFAVNKAVPVQEGRWQLIGITGYHQNQDTSNNVNSSGSTGDNCQVNACMDMGANDAILINIKGGNALATAGITWDANGTGDFNGLVAPATLAVFTDGQSATNYVFASNRENNGSTLGEQTHSIIGLYALPTAATSLNRVAMSFVYDKTQATFAKHYTSSIKSMFVRSPLAESNAPDVEIKYQDTLEGQDFKIQFSTTTEFAQNTPDQVYIGKFKSNHTYDKPLRQDPANPDNPDSLRLAPSPSLATQAESAFTDFRSIARVFDMNLTDNNESTSGYFDPYTNNERLVQRLNGNLTVYEFARDLEQAQWKVASIYGNGQEVTQALPQDGTLIIDTDKDDYSDFTKGKGYWVRFEADALAKPDYNTTNAGGNAHHGGNVSIPGFLAGDSMKPEDYTADLVKEGWNLLGFNDADLRYAATGIFVPTTVNAGFNIVAKNGAVYAPVATGADAIAMATNTNAAIAKATKEFTDEQGEGTTTNFQSVNGLNIRAYPVAIEDLQGILLVSDEVFGIDLPNGAIGGGDPTIFRTLAGAQYQKFDTNVTFAANTEIGVVTDGQATSTHQRLYSRYGEYLLAAKLNVDVINFNNDTYKQKFAFSVTVPALEAGGAKKTAKIAYAGAGGNEWGLPQANSPHISQDINKSVSELLSSVTTNVPYHTDLYNGRAQGAAWVDLESNTTVFIAANKRFYVTDDTYIRTFKLTPTAYYENEDNNGTAWGVRVTGDGKTDDMAFTFEDVGTLEKANGLLMGGVADGANTGVGMAIFEKDLNRSVMFFGNSISNYDVLERNQTAQTASTEEFMFDALHDVPAESLKDKNGTVLGALTDVYSVKELSTAAIMKGYALNVPTYRGITNLKNTPIYAPSFPNDGPLYYLSATGLRPEILMAATTSTHNSLRGNTVITWNAVDVTRNPADWFNDSTDFDLLQTQYGKGYWVYLTKGTDISKLVSIDKTSIKSAITGYHHFDNDVTGQALYSNTYNHADGSVDVKIGGLYRKAANGQVYTSGESFNVEGVLNGQKVEFNTESTIQEGSNAKFTVRLNSYETSGFDTPNSAPVAMDIQAADGLGSRAVETNVSIPYVKPSNPILAIDKSLLKLESIGASHIFLYQNNISDISYKSDMLAEFAMTVADNKGTVDIDTSKAPFKDKVAYPKAVDVADAPTDLNGSKGLPSGVLDLRLIAATAEKKALGTSTPVFLSNQYHLRYAPIYTDTLILETAAQAGIDNKPYDVAAGKALEENTGIILVQPGSVKTAIAYKKPTALSATSIGTSSFAQTLYVGSDVSGDVLATIQYTNDYIGQYVFLQSGDDLYYLVLPNTASGNIAGNSATSGKLYAAVKILGSLQKIEKPGGGNAPAGGGAAGGGGNAPAGGGAGGGGAPANP